LPLAGGRFAERTKAMTTLILKRPSASRLSGEWSDDDFDVLADGVVVGRIFKANAAPVSSPWIWTLAFGHHEDEGARRYRVEAKGLSLPFRALPRMGQKEEPGCVGSDAGGRGGLELSRCPNNPEHDCRYEAHGK
jgi:hypothetical protein